MEFKKLFVICPNCKLPTDAYMVGEEEVNEKEGIYMPYVAVANFCTFCAYDLRFMHKKCEICGFTDWADVFPEECPYCKLKKVVNKEKVEKRLEKKLKEEMMEGQK